jgi:hypothetical protein
MTMKECRWINMQSGVLQGFKQSQIGALKNRRPRIFLVNERATEIENYDADGQDHESSRERV